MITINGDYVAFQRGNVIAFDPKSQKVYAFKDRTFKTPLEWCMLTKNPDKGAPAKYLSEDTFVQFVIFMGNVANLYPKHIEHERFIAFEFETGEDVDAIGYAFLAAHRNKN